MPVCKDVSCCIEAGKTTQRAIEVESSEGITTMMFDDTIKLHATAADDDHTFGDEPDDEQDDVHRRFNDDNEEEEEVTMTSEDDDAESQLDDEDTDDDFHGTHAEDAKLFALPPSPVSSYQPPTKESKLPVSQSAVSPVKSTAKKVAATPAKKLTPAKKAAPAKKATPAKSAAKKVSKPVAAKKVVAKKVAAKK